MAFALDERDLKILAVLQKNGRMTKTELAEHVNLSPTPCWERLKKLEQSGIIEGYSANVSLKILGSVSVIFMEAEISSHRAVDFERFEKAVLEIPEIVECWAVGGGIDYIVKFLCGDVDTYQRLVDKLLNSDIGLRRYYSYVVTKPVKFSQIPPLELYEYRNDQ
ncbi:Lrp/AsnC family transcriptional regulator [uncultured Sneathiella sp.]|uniref:Lrp/AsnC family transcriptional regulator n=1 Tax=uncultured Sneathiella sp. TaxID=879315 RepID=UPI0030ED843F|tara:strand:- start:19712 stop:20203 length:492 start_codon:yes stop_codon:yes gene_type:complete